MQELLKYQELDANLRKVSQSLASSESRKKANEMQQYLRNTQDKLLQLDKSAEAVSLTLKKVKQDYNAMIDRVEELVKKSASSSIDEVEACEQEVSKLAEKLSRMERDLNNLQGKLLGINKEFEGLMKNAKTAKANLGVYKQDYDKQKALYEPQIEKLKAEISEQKKKVRPELLAKYNSKAEGKIFPIFVALKDNRCSGCRMEVSAGRIKDLQTGHLIECENCGRIIYRI